MKIVLSDIAILLNDWLLDLQRLDSRNAQNELQVDTLDDAISSYLQDTATDNVTREIFLNIRKQLQQHR